MQLRKIGPGTDQDALLDDDVILTTVDTAMGWVGTCSVCRSPI